MEIAAGTQTEALTFLAELGRGGMGTVYLAEDRGLGKRCAVKVLHQHLTQDETARTRFRNEVRAAAAIDHPAIVKTYAIDELADGRLCCRMEFVEGPTLSAFCRRKGEPLPLGLILRIIGPICEAFDLLHELRIVHRDLKPENVLIVERSGQVYPRVLDFSIAKRTDEPRLTRPGLAPGTAAYMAPEQARGGSVDRSCDVYSLGVMMYWMATGGHLPYEVSDAVWYFAQVNEAPVDPRRRFSGISELAASVIVTAIHPDPARRPRSMGALALMFARCVTGDALQPDGTAILRECAPGLLIVGNLDETLRSPGVLTRRGSSAAMWKYDYGPVLGKGGMAEVVRATLRGEGQFAAPRALKLILPEFAASPEFEQWFHQEARIAAMLEHRNIVRVLDHDRDPMGRLYLAMEFVEGVDVEKLRLSGPMPPAVIIFVLCEVLEALDFAHNLPPTSPLASAEEITSRGGARGIVHRDVSHHNVLVSWLADVKLSDFGIAKLRTATAAAGSKLIKGKPGYMSPEQASAQDKLDGRSDLWAIGVMLWELLTGQLLFTGDNFVAIAFAICSDEIPRPSVVRPGVPPDLEAIAMRLLERDLTKRFQTARDVIVALHASPFASRGGRAELARHLAGRFPERARPVPSPPSQSAMSDNTHPPRGESSSPGQRAFAVSGLDSAAPASPSTADHALGQAINGPARRSSRWPWMAAIGIAIGTIAIVALAGRADRSSANAITDAPSIRSEPPERASMPPRPAVHQSGIAPPSSASVPTASTVTATIATEPTGATIRIEAKDMPTRIEHSPLTVQVAPGTQLHIHAELDGFKSEVKHTTVTENGQAIALSLTPREAPARPAKTVRRPNIPPSAAPAAKPKTPRPTVPNDDPGIIE